MNPIRTIVIAGCMAGLATGAWAQAPASRMVILVQDVETASTRAARGKYLDVKTSQMLPQESALTDADRAMLDPESLGRIRELEIEDRMRDRLLEREAVERDNRRRQEIADLLRQEAMATGTGRNIIQAKDWISESLRPYREVIQLIDRSDMDVAMDETARNAEGTQSMYGGVTHLMRVIVGDMSTERTTAESHGTKTVRTRQSLNVSVAVSDLYNRQVFNQSFTGTKDSVATSYGGTVGGNDHEELLRNALKQAGPAMAKSLTARLTLDVRGSEDDPDFDPGHAVVRVNGQERTPGEEIVLPKGRHTIHVEVEGYQPVEQTIDLTSDVKRPVVLRADHPAAVE